MVFIVHLKAPKMTFHAKRYFSLLGHDPWQVTRCLIYLNLKQKDSLSRVASFLKANTKQTKPCNFLDLNLCSREVRTCTRGVHTSLLSQNGMEKNKGCGFSIFALRAMKSPMAHGLFHVPMGLTHKNK